MPKVREIDPMLSPGTKVRIKKPPKGSEAVEKLVSGRRLWWVEDMDHLDGSDQEVDHPDGSPWIRLVGMPYRFAHMWLDELPTPGLETVSAGMIPRNNDGRNTCFWCHIPTAKRGGGAYDLCPKCGR